MIFLALCLCYFAGSIPVGFLVGKTRGVDVRAVGSGNVGATNVWRALGPAAGTIVFALDVLKGAAGPIIGVLLLGKENPVSIALCGVMALLGHVFSLFLKFRGGKGIATGLGVMLGLAPAAGLSCLALWGVVLLLSRTISLASIVACLALPIAAFFFHAPTPYFVVIVLMSSVALLKHIPNMKRLVAGVEPKIGGRESTPDEERENTPDEGKE